MFEKRTGLIVWLRDLKQARVLERYGNVHYVSKQLRYAVMYVNSSQEEQIINQLNQLNFVKQVEYSYRKEIKTEYSSKGQDKTEFYPI